MEDIGDHEVERMAPLCSGTIPHASHVTYNSCSAQGLTIDGGDRWLRLPIPSRLQTEPIHYSLGDEVVGGASIKK